MAYIAKEKVKMIRDQIKAAYPNYKWSVRRRDYTAVDVALMESDLPFEKGYIQINNYWYQDSKELTPEMKAVFKKVLEIMNDIEPCYNRNAGDPYADYGDNTYFIDIQVGRWDKPHKLISAV